MPTEIYGPSTAAVSDTKDKPASVDPARPEAKKAGRRSPRRKRAQNDLIVKHNYHDYAKVDAFDLAAQIVATNPSQRRGQRNGTCFPMQLHRMLDEVTKEGRTDVVSWNEHGRAFVVRKPHDFTREIMPRFFKQNKYTSFQRQLNLYGFLRLSKGADNGGYYHELFLRGKPDLSLAMRRVKVKGTFKKPKRNPEQEPDFSSMEAVGGSGVPQKPSECITSTSELASPSAVEAQAALTELCAQDDSPNGRQDNSSCRKSEIPCLRSELEVAEINDLIAERKAHVDAILPLRKRHILPLSRPSDLGTQDVAASSTAAMKMTNGQSQQEATETAYERAAKESASATQSGLKDDFEQNCNQDLPIAPHLESTLSAMSNEARAPTPSSNSSKQYARKHWKKRPLVFYPNPNDVLCGRGGWINMHPGNFKYRDAVKRRRRAYWHATTKSEKVRISRDVVDFIHGLNPRGRFLRRVDGVARSSEDGKTESGAIWVELDDIDARCKTSQALREGAPDIRVSRGQFSRGTLTPNNAPPIVKRNNSTVEGARQLVLLSSMPAKADDTDGLLRVEAEQKNLDKAFDVRCQTKPLSPTATPSTGADDLGAGKLGSVHAYSKETTAALSAPVTSPAPLSLSDSAHELRSHGSFSSFIDPLKEIKEKAVRDWLMDAVPYLGWDDVKAYSRQLIANGFDSAQILEDFLLAEDLDFMKTAHRRALVAAKIAKRS